MECYNSSVVVDDFKLRPMAYTHQIPVNIKLNLDNHPKLGKIYNN